MWTIFYDCYHKVLRIQLLILKIIHVNDLYVVRSIFSYTCTKALTQHFVEFSHAIKDIFLFKYVTQLKAKRENWLFKVSQHNQILRA